jgi:hypothetical protein
MAGSYTVVQIFVAFVAFVFPSSARRATRRLRWRTPRPQAIHNPPGTFPEASRFIGSRGPARFVRKRA